MSGAGRWLAPVTPRPSAGLRLLGIPHCGGGAALFRAWPAALPEWIEVWAAHLPGRDERRDDPASHDLAAVADALTEAAASLPLRPLALFGHSLGGLIAFEVARRLQARGTPAAALIVSACAAPQAAPAAGPIHQLADGAFLEAVAAFGGLPPEIVADPEMRAEIVPVLRADFMMCETYRYEPGERLRLPLAVFGGLQDRAVPRSALEGWREQGSGRFALTLLPGDHFYLREESGVCRALGRELGALPGIDRG
jgi:surfactin synthase thioesterase subunit